MLSHYYSYVSFDIGLIILFYALIKTNNHITPTIIKGAKKSKIFHNRLDFCFGIIASMLLPVCNHSENLFVLLHSR